MADEKKDAAPEPGYRSLDRKGMWFLSKSVFPMEDPTNVHEQGKGAAMPRFEGGSYTQAPETSWTESQWRAGVLVKHTGDPRDEGTKPIVYEEPKAAPVAPVAEVKADEKKSAAK